MTPFARFWNAILSRSRSLKIRAIDHLAGDVQRLRNTSLLCAQWAPQNNDGPCVFGGPNLFPRTLHLTFVVFGASLFNKLRDPPLGIFFHYPREIRPRKWRWWTVRGKHKSEWCLCRLRQRDACHPFKGRRISNMQMINLARAMRLLYSVLRRMNIVDATSQRNRSCADSGSLDRPVRRAERDVLWCSCRAGLTGMASSIGCSPSLDETEYSQGYLRAPRTRDYTNPSNTDFGQALANGCDGLLANDQRVAIYRSMLGRWLMACGHWPMASEGPVTGQ